MNRKKTPDWFVRAVKTFVQAFFGVLVPETAVILRQGWPKSWAAVWAYLAPVVAAALAGAIAAVWNLLLEQLRTGDDLSAAARSPSPEGEAKR